MEEVTHPRSGMKLIRVESIARLFEINMGKVVYVKLWNYKHIPIGFLLSMQMREAVKVFNYGIYERAESQGDRADEIKEEPSQEMKRAFALQAVDVLNRALEADPVAINELLKVRTPCNMKLADDPSIQVATLSADLQLFDVGIMGIINGIIGADPEGFGFVAVCYELNEKGERGDTVSFEFYDRKKLKALPPYKSKAIIEHEPEEGSS